jgi:hypothetical protein
MHHPLDAHPSFRAVIAAAPPLADLARATSDEDLVRRLAIACGDLVHGFSSPDGSTERRRAHHRAWVSVRELDRAITAARLSRKAPSRLVARAQRAVDRADVFISALPGVLP